MRNIKRKLLRVGYTLPEFSKKTGIHYCVLIRALSGKYNTAFKTCLKIIHASEGAIELEDFLSPENLAEYRKWQEEVSQKFWR